MISALLKPKIIDNVSESIKRNKEKIKQSYDKTTRNPITLEVGQPVSVQLQPSTNKHWTPGTVADVLSDRSYIVNVDDTQYRRNLSHIRPSSSQNVPENHNAPLSSSPHKSHNSHSTHQNHIEYHDQPNVSE
jgi:hypothetical protein